MAIQKGIIKITGKLGDLIFYRSKDKYLSRQAPKAYNLSEKTKQSGKDFGEASRNANYIRKAFSKLIDSYADNDVINRLNKKLIDVFKTIPKSNFGNKKLIDGNISLLKGFDFNRYTTLDKLLFHLPKIELKEKGVLNITLEKIKMKDFISLKAPNAITACLNLMLFSYDLQGEQYEIFSLKELEVSLAGEFEGRKRSIQLEINGNKALIMGLSIDFKRERYRSKDRNFYAFQIIEALHLKDGEIVAFVDPDIEDQTGHKEEDNDLDWESID